MTDEKDCPYCSQGYLCKEHMCVCDYGEICYAHKEAK